MALLLLDHRSALTLQARHSDVRRLNVSLLSTFLSLPKHLRNARAEGTGSDGANKDNSAAGTGCISLAELKDLLTQALTHVPYHAGLNTATVSADSSASNLREDIAAIVGGAKERDKGLVILQQYYRSLTTALVGALLRFKIPKDRQAALWHEHPLLALLAQANSGNSTYTPSYYRVGLVTDVRVATERIGKLALKGYNADQDDREIMVDNADDMAYLLASLLRFNVYLGETTSEDLGFGFVSDGPLTMPELSVFLRSLPFPLQSGPDGGPARRDVILGHGSIVPFAWAQLTSPLLQQRTAERLQGLLSCAGAVQIQRPTRGQPRPSSAAPRQGESVDALLERLCAMLAGAEGPPEEREEADMDIPAERALVQLRQLQWLVRICLAPQLTYLRRRVADLEAQFANDDGKGDAHERSPLQSSSLADLQAITSGIVSSEEKEALRREVSSLRSERDALMKEKEELSKRNEKMKLLLGEHITLCNHMANILGLPTRAGADPNASVRWIPVQEIIDGLSYFTLTRKN